MALRMQTQLWRVTGRGWGPLLGGLTGFANAHPHAGPLLQVARAACLRDVCQHDSSKGVELVMAMQVSLLLCLAASLAALRSSTCPSLCFVCPVALSCCRQLVIFLVQPRLLSTPQVCCPKRWTCCQESSSMVAAQTLLAQREQ